MTSRFVFILLLTCAGLAPFQARAMFMRYEIQQVPIGRLFTNLQQRLARNTNNFEVTYDLTRLHSMAYATNLITIAVRTNTDRPEFYSPGSDSGVPKRVALPASPAARAQALRHLTNAIQLFERAIVLLKKSTNTAAVWLVLPLELGHAWCLDQAGARPEALSAYRKALALAWKKEVTGEFSFKDWAEESWNAAKSGRNPLGARGRRGGYVGPGPAYSEEIIGYMLALLDPVKDAKEIAELKGREKVLASAGRAITPILVPLRDGAALSDFVNPNAEVTFDLDGSGLPRRWGWINTNAAWLVFDPQHTGEITSALQMFGNVTFWIFWLDGYHALGSLDDNLDGALRGPELRGLALWQDQNLNGVSEPGEVRPVTDWEITEISCTGQTGPGGDSWCATGVTFRNGRTRPTYDWTAPSPALKE